MPTTAKLSASLTFMVWPLRALTVSMLPSSFSTVPRIRTGGLAGACAKATADTATSVNAATARIIGGSLGVSGCARLTVAIERYSILPVAASARTLLLLEATSTPGDRPWQELQFPYPLLQSRPLPHVRLTIRTI